ncbi:MAG: hypothetical protein DRP10_00745 [Candidatus Aenigmatarchaeota archaeon]|mgnify:CR=1 FL=1|nr:MAG: hypothetical protein DRP10_00745 [Candidatus Aenigmarchaeota archaeon]
MEENEEFGITKEDMQIVPEEPVKFYMPPTMGIRKPSHYKCFSTKNGKITVERIGNIGFLWTIPYKVVENAIQEIKEKDPENYSS